MIASGVFKATKDQNKRLTVMPDISLKDSEMSSHSSFWHNMEAEDAKSNESYDFTIEEKLRELTMKKNREKLEADSY